MTPSAFAPLDVVVLLRGPSALPCLATHSATPRTDAHCAGLGPWLPDASGGVVRLLATEADLDAIEHDPAVVTWGAVEARADRTVAA